MMFAANNTHYVKLRTTLPFFSVLPRCVIMVTVNSSYRVSLFQRSSGEMFIGETPMNEVLLLLMCFLHCFPERALRVSGKIQRAITAILFLW